jgi:hypothetical protein
MGEPTRYIRALMKLLATLLLALSLIAAGCGGDDEEEKSADKPAATTQTQAQPDATTEPDTTTEAAPPAESSEEDQEAVREAVIKWTFEGKCEYMTDKFLEDQLLGLGDSREEKCDLFEKQHQKPQYGEDDLKIEDVNVTGAKASLIVTSEIAPDIKSRYDLVKSGDQWQIDAAELE